MTMTSAAPFEKLIDDAPIQSNQKHIYFTICGHEFTKAMVVGAVVLAAVVLAISISVVATAGTSSDGGTVYYESAYYSNVNIGPIFPTCSLKQGEWVQCIQDYGGGIKQRLNSDGTVDICVSGVASYGDSVSYVPQIDLKDLVNESDNDCVKVAYEWIQSSGTRYYSWSHYLCQTDGSKDADYLHTLYYKNYYGDELPAWYPGDRLMAPDDVDLC